jgi:hypothetical protein
LTLLPSCLAIDMSAAAEPWVWSIAPAFKRLREQARRIICKVPDPAPFALEDYAHRAVTCVEDFLDVSRRVLANVTTYANERRDTSREDALIAMDTCMDKFARSFEKLEACLAQFLPFSVENNREYECMTAEEVAVMPLWEQRYRAAVMRFWHMHDGCHRPLYHRVLVA